MPFVTKVRPGIKIVTGTYYADNAEQQIEVYPRKCFKSYELLFLKLKCLPIIEFAF